MCTSAGCVVEPQLDFSHPCDPAVGGPRACGPKLELDGQAGADGDAGADGGGAGGQAYADARTPARDLGAGPDLAGGTSGAPEVGPVQKDADPPDAVPPDADPPDADTSDARAGADAGQVDRGPADAAAATDGPPADAGAADGGSADVGVVGRPCEAGDLTPPCNGCPAGTVVPPGFVCAPAGTFIQGEVGNGGPRPVTLTRPFFIQVTEVTQGEWQALMGNNPANFADCGATCPVETVSWWDAAAFANARSVAEGLPVCYDRRPEQDGEPTIYDCAGYRLPTEAEWEYAHRAGTQTRFYWGGDAAQTPEYAWFQSNSNRRTSPVGRKLPNAWGLHDIAGNVSEWVHDGDVRIYPEGEVSDPFVPGQVAESRRLRGGNWADTTQNLEAADRSSGATSAVRFNRLGLRLARTSLP